MSDKATGEWIEHDGGGCPLDDDGRHVEVEGKIGLIVAPAFIVKWANVKRYKLVKIGEEPKP